MFHREKSWCSTTWLLFAVAALNLASCSQDEGRILVFPVSGTLTFQGMPATGALVTFHPVDSPLPAALQPNGKVADDGSFKLTTYESGDGAPAGNYAVTVFWPEPPASPVEAPDSGPDRFRGRYLDPQKSTWRVTVTDGTNALEPFELK